MKGNVLSILNKEIMLVLLIRVSFLWLSFAYIPIPGSIHTKRRGSTLTMTSKHIIAPKFDESVGDAITLTRYMDELVAANPDLREVETIFLSLQIACKKIGNAIERAPISGLVGLQGGGGSINIQGEEQKKYCA
jgi:hypothetical protein